MTAKIPAKDQLIEAIKNGNDNLDNCLVLNENSKFHVIPLDDFTRYENENTYIARNENTYARHGYIGVGASRDAEFISIIYKEFLTAWLTYLSNGDTQILCDGSQVSEKTEQELLVEIEEKVQ